MSPSNHFDEEINILDFIFPIFKRWKFLVIFMFGVVSFAAIYTFRTPKTYEATAVILPEPKPTDGGIGVELKAAFLEQFGVSGIGNASSTPSEVFEAVIRSEYLARQVLDRYNYFYVMGITDEDEEFVTRSFVRAVNVEKGEAGPTLSITIQSGDPLLAADLTNSYIEALDKYNQSNTITSARRLRKYIEDRLKTANYDLEKAQKELWQFQDKNKAISIEKQTKATIEILSELEAQRVILEIEKAAKEKFYKGPHLQIEESKAKMEAVQKNINRLMYSNEDKIPISKEKGKVEFYIPLIHIPALNFEESRILLKVKAKTSVVTMLTTQLEQAKLDETKDMPTINVLDWAQPSTKPIKPNLKLNIILSVVISFFLGTFFVFCLEYFQRVNQNSGGVSKWIEMKKELKQRVLERRSIPQKNDC